MINQSFTVVVASLFGVAVVCAASKPVTVDLKDAKGQSVGTATLTGAKGGSGVTIKLNVKDLPPGEHAAHIHQAATGEGPGFPSAAPPFDPPKEPPRLAN